ncbi:LOW QUALITY PROTEIN: pentatricopeptide repeat-containing protein At1g31790-like [Chenopodium quinoa]|uniref:LOW QUALITY PROTEIN: pentatricopeptide repeat-containing protein At1g31790-like n=1 Tax=Chenopodium quinoa TaxID=63459 RepID=UPI000B787DA3|nr:LOW QUALITY PROTEIN: pentatricopeptide repeat-containing protein At1g31790-like [Chenopodium quinoa]
MYEFRENVYIITTDIYVSLVVECTQKRDAIEAAAIYTHMKKNAGIVRFLKGSTGLCLLNRILLMLVSCGCFDVAHQLFDEMPRRNFISLAIVMAALIDNHLFEEALGLFVKMYRCFVYQEFDSGLEVVLVSFLKACVHLKEVDLGKMVHGWMLKMGYDRGLVVDTALVEFYGKSGCLMEANHVFFDLIRVVDHRDTVLWTGVIVNNGREQCFGEVIRIFRVMGEAGVRMNEYTFSTVLKACGRVGDGGLFGQQIHANAIKLGFDSHVFVMCALIDMYGRCGLLNDAKRVFDRMDRRKRNNACWNAMVTGFIHHGLYIDALKTLYEMKAAGLKPQKSVMDEVRLACGSLKLEIT